MASSSGREEFLGRQPAHNVYSNLTRQPVLDPNRVACCYFKAKSSRGALNASGQGILLHLPDNESTPLVIITSHQLIPSTAHAKQWLIGFDPKKKEFDLEKYLDSSQVQLRTCCGEEHSLWENTYQHLEKKCPMNGDFTIFLLSAGMSNEIYASFGDILDIPSTDDCMNYHELEQLMENRLVVNIYQRMPTWVSHETLIIPPQAVDGTNSLTSHVKAYQNSYSSFAYDSQLKQDQSFSVMGAPIMYTDRSTQKNQLLGMHMYLPMQSVQYGISFSHILEILRSFTPNLCPFHPRLPRKGHIPILCLLYQSVTGGRCTPKDYMALSSFIDKYWSQLFSQTDLLLILDYLVERKLLFAQPTSGADDITMKLASFKVIKSLCKPFVHLSDDDISGVLATVQMHCPDKSPQEMWNSVRELCEMVADSMVAQVDVALTEGWFLCWEAMLKLRDLVVSVLCDPRSHCLRIVNNCQALHSGNPTVQRCFAAMMKACAYTRLQMIYLLEEEKNDLKEEHAKKISLLEKRLQESELEKAKAQEKVKVLSEQSSSQLVELLAEETKKKDKLVEEKLAQLEEENKELRMRLQELQDLLKPISASNQLIHQTAKKCGSSSSIVYSAVTGMNKLYGSKAGDYPDFTDGGGRSGRAYNGTQSQPVTPSERIRPELRRPFSSPGNMSHYAYSLDQSLEEYPLHAEGRNRLSFSSTASSESVFDPDVERDMHPSSFPRTQSWSPSSPPTPARPERTTRSKSLSIPKPILEDYGVVEDPEREKRFKEIVTQQREKFLLFTNFNNLGSILSRERLINADELRKLTDPQTPSKERACYFYDCVLHTKGESAYSLLQKCLAQEYEHRGHKDLLKMLV